MNVQAQGIGFLRQRALLVEWQTVACVVTLSRVMRSTFLTQEGRLHTSTVSLAFLLRIMAKWKQVFFSPAWRIPETPLETNVEKISLLGDSPWVTLGKVIQIGKAKWEKSSVDQKVN